MVKVPNTITDKEYVKLQERAQKAQPSLFDPQVVKKRKASSKQKYKSEQS